MPLLLTGAAPAPAQPAVTSNPEPASKAELRRYLKNLQPKMRALRRKGRYSEMMPPIARALKLAERFYGRNDVATLVLLIEYSRLLIKTGQLAKAEISLKRADRVFEAGGSTAWAGRVQTLTSLGTVYFRQGRQEKARSSLEQSVELVRQNKGENNPQFAFLLGNLGEVFRQLGQLGKAEKQFLRVLEILEAQQKKSLGVSKIIATTKEKLAKVYQSTGQFPQAIRLFREALELQATLGDPLGMATMLADYSSLLARFGQIELAEKSLQKALYLREKFLGADHLMVASVLNSLANFNLGEGRLDKAEELLSRAFKIVQRAGSGAYATKAVIMNSIGRIHILKNRLSEAERILQQAIRMIDDAGNSRSILMAMTLANASEVAKRKTDYLKAERYARRALDIYESTEGGSSPRIGVTLNNLALIYSIQGRFTEATNLFKRVLKIAKRKNALRSEDLIIALNNIASLYRKSGAYFRAAQLDQMALKAMISFKKWKKGTRLVSALNNLGLDYIHLERPAEAAKLFERALGIKEKLERQGYFVTDQPTLNLAESKRRLGQLDEARRLLESTVANRHKIFGDSHPEYAGALQNLAQIMFDQEQSGQAFKQLRRATKIYRQQERVAAAQGAGFLSRHRDARKAFLYHLLSIFEHAGRTEKELNEAFANETFELFQLLGTSSTGTAVRRMALRFSTRSDELAKLIRQRQIASKRLRAEDAQLIAKLGRSFQGVRIASAAKSKRSKLITELNLRNRELRQRFPDHAELLAPPPLTIEAARKIMSSNEALIAFATTGRGTFSMALSNNDFIFNWSPMTETQLAKAVGKLRAGLDLTNLHRKRGLFNFSPAIAHKLYAELIRPLENVLKNKTHVMVVMDGPLTSLPISVLLTRPAENPVREIADYRNLAWFAKKYATSVLPSITSLRALRRFATPSKAKRPFLGIGDPLLADHPNLAAGRAPGRTETFENWRSPPSSNLPQLKRLFRGRIARVDLIRRAASVPESALGLLSMARSRNADISQSLYLRERATETYVRRIIPLRDFRVITFWTHGLVAGDMPGLSEPALLLTPPERGTIDDDGLLTASEVSELELDADWVILSACNTASPDGKPGAEGFSGLTRAFLFAGSRSIFASHWPVSRAATMRMLMEMFARLRNETWLGRAQAHRRTMLAMLNDKHQPLYAHPMFWSPFVIVGEGGKLKR